MLRGIDRRICNGSRARGRVLPLTGCVGIIRGRRGLLQADAEALVKAINAIGHMGKGIAGSLAILDSSSTSRMVGRRHALPRRPRWDASRDSPTARSSRWAARGRPAIPARGGRRTTRHPGTGPHPGPAVVWIPASAGMTANGDAWIPAFAGMTDGPACAGATAGPGRAHRRHAGAPERGRAGLCAHDSSPRRTPGSRPSRSCGFRLSPE